MDYADKIAETYRSKFEVRDGDVQSASWDYIQGVIAEAVREGYKLASGAI